MQVIDLQIIIIQNYSFHFLFFQQLRLQIL